MTRLANSIGHILLAVVVVFQMGLFHRCMYEDHVRSEFAVSLSSINHFEDTTATRNSPNWKPVYVYRGGPPLVSERRWNGQAEQDKLISWLTKNMTNRYFVDLAANGAEHLSNTLSLERHFNWNGLCIEANPIYWNELARFRSCTVLGAVIGKQANEKVMFAMAGPMGGITGTESTETEERYTAHLGKTFETFKVPKLIDYFSLDVEGAEEFIMDAFPFDRYKIRFLTVERPSPNLTLKLADHGYRRIIKLTFFGEILFAHESEMPIDMAIIDRYCADSGGKFCGEKDYLLGFRLSLNAMQKELNRMNASRHTSRQRVTPS
ncbi:methyltransferase [Fragilaria crotonensis]|nr:methyltransferase [Fragilaria crotonensis]